HGRFLRRFSIARLARDGLGSIRYLLISLPISFASTAASLRTFLRASSVSRLLCSSEVRLFISRILHRLSSIRSSMSMRGGLVHSSSASAGHLPLRLVLDH
ncbi:hypothetical protein PMAYCL1PPCAC_07307, partial [Pristionchus mayeri]